jgi:hypothetical protein
MARLLLIAAGLAAVLPGLASAQAVDGSAEISPAMIAAPLLPEDDIQAEVDKPEALRFLGWAARPRTGGEAVAAREAAAVRALEAKGYNGIHGLLPKDDMVIAFAALDGQESRVQVTADGDVQPADREVANECPSRPKLKEILSCFQ